MLPRFEKPEDFQEYLEQNYYFGGNPYLSSLHMLMVVMILEREEDVKRQFAEFREFFNHPLTDTEKELFLSALYEAMRLWAHELRKARDFKFALKSFIDGKEYKHKLGEEYFFYHAYPS
jgi:hypothetical protein